MKILIIDHAPETVELLTDYLSKRGHDVVSITGGAHAASWVQNKKFKLVFLDLEVRDADGLALVGEITRAGANVVAMSGQPEETWATAARSRGACGSLKKPITLEALERLLERL